MPIDYKCYPANWKAISLRIRTERAKNCCEWCGAINGQPHPITGSKVVLTCAHLGTAHADGRPGNKHDKFDVRDENLAALCNYCHLNFDRSDHIRNAAITRLLKKIRVGQLTFLDDPIYYVESPSNHRMSFASDIALEHQE